MSHENSPQDNNSPALNVVDTIVSSEPSVDQKKRSFPASWNRLKLAAAGLAVAFLLIFPLINAQNVFAVNLLSEILIYSIFAQSLDLLLGYTGLVSFGHAAYFGLGAYTAAIITAQLKYNSFFPSLLLGAGIAGLGALILGFFSIRTSGIYFLMLTLAFSQMLYALAFKWNDVTGGSNGLPVPSPDLGVFDLKINLADPVSFYFVTLACFLTCFIILRQVVRSAFGRTLAGIRNNENRMAALGYYTRNYKLVAFMIAGSLAGVAGVLNVFHNNFVSSNDFYWTNSGLVMIMVLIGGKGSLAGPIFGAAFVRYTEQFIQGQTFMLGTFVVADRWQMVLGAIFILLVIIAPGGFVGLWKSFLIRLLKKAK